METLLSGAPLTSARDGRAVARNLIDQSAAAVQQCEALLDHVVSIGEEISARIFAGGKILVCGNGGSAADAQHFVAELIGRFQKERDPLPAIALTTDSSVLTAVANDYSYADVFARQVRALARPGDVLVGISTSGRSENILRAFAATPLGVLRVALTGTAGLLAEIADVGLLAPGGSTAEIQAAHGVLIHALCAVIESSVE